MTVSSALNAGVMGLAVNSTRLGTIADNIANSDTIGYKRVSAEFQSMVVSARPNAYSAGGVRVQVTRDVEDEGALVATGNATDLAIDGRGLLPVTNEAGIDPLNTDPDFLMVPTGSFTPDANGYLRTASGLFLMGWPADSLGDVGAVSRQSGESLVPVRLATSAFTSTPTRIIEMGVNLPADATSAGSTGDPYETTLEYFDNFGRAQVLSVTFTPTVPATGASNFWSVEVFDNSTGTPVSVASFDVEFQDTQTNGGTILDVTNNASYDPVTGQISFAVPSGNLDMIIGTPGGRNGLTQFATDFSPYNLAKDGASIGNLVNAEVDSFGRVQAIYDSGFRQVLYQIPIVEVPNLNGLEAIDSQAFRVSQSSGDIYLWDAASGPVGSMVGNTLMESTVDIATELTALIETQRAYSSNAKIIQTVDEILQETTNIIR